MYIRTVPSYSHALIDINLHESLHSPVRFRSPQQHKVLHCVKRALNKAIVLSKCVCVYIPIEAHCGHVHMQYRYLFVFLYYMYVYVWLHEYYGVHSITFATCQYCVSC